ncbi:peptide ABC transporter substrate-binding protein [Clostridium septicum]|uniref:peptide ABC transporter substrate-binding protein n=1 Tax=Clostridium septicum TaxID=1504 RepID=UPI00083673EA|nr:peptide ABC transporter substrate-binding protein [Clostridium septicum]WLF70722.1 peptide ABC transporter substrate-binding protein [Clostridium septicum]
MKSSKLKKICAVALTLALGMTVLAGCGGDKGDTGKTLIYNLGADPKTIDPALNEAVDGSTIISNAFEGLCRLDENEKAIPGVAKEWKISDDGLVYTFTLRDDAKWSDGQLVTAKDFEYAWKRALDPKTAAAYAYQLYYIKGAEAYNTGKGEVENLGIKVVDEKTLEVTLENVTPYFLELMAFPTYMPIRQDIVEASGDAWTQSPETYISNGPFKMKEWAMKEKIVFEKNENYWNKDSVKLDTLDVRLGTDEVSAYAELKAGNFHMTDTIPVEEMEQAKKDGLYQQYSNLATYFFCFNVGNNVDKIENQEVKKALGNKKVRQALSIAVNRQAIVDNITKAGQVPAYSFVPQGIEVVAGKDFADKKYYDVNGDLEKAKALLDEAGYPNGEGFPKMTILINSEGTGHKNIAQYLQDTWKKIGVDVEIQNQEWQVFQTTRNEGNFQIARHGWSGDYVDPMTFLDMWTSVSGSNDVGLKNDEYDATIKAAKGESDPAKRAELFRKAEDILMDEGALIPLYYYTKVKGVDPKVKGFRVSTLGQVFFDQAYIEE